MRSEGNPLFTEELLAAGLDGRGAMPPTLRDALMVRIERLSEDAQEILRVLAAGLTTRKLLTRARERQIKRQGGHARKCPLCGVKPRCLPRNADGSLSRSRTTDAQKFAAGAMTAAQLAEHTALRRGAATGKLPRPFERGPLAEDPWAARPACPVLAEAVR